MKWPFHNTDEETREQYLVRAMQWLLETASRIEERQTTMTKAMDDFKVQLGDYFKKNDDAWAAAMANQMNSDALVAAAVAKAEAGEDVDVRELSDMLAAEAAKVPPMPVAPVAVPDTPPPSPPDQTAA